MKTNCHGCASENLNSDFCGCCEGTKILTPLSTANRPGLSALSYRIGTHASFLETMKARLASNDFPELADLSARDSNDPSIALLDAWAAVADVLSFYQERIANEGYLRTATERRSVLELGRLVGYKMRPGVSSSVFLAYNLDPNTKDEVVIPAGSRVQSIPGPGELPQTFESSEDLKAHSGWNNLRPRMTQPQIITRDTKLSTLYLKGINTNLKPNDPLLIDFGDDKDPTLDWVKEVKPDAQADRTLVLLEGSTINNTISHSNFIDLVHSLTKQSSFQSRNSLGMKRIVREQFAEKSGSGYRALENAVPTLRGTLTVAAKNKNFTEESKKIKIYALRKKAAPFGHNAPMRAKQVGVKSDLLIMKTEYEEWEIDKPFGCDQAAQPAVHSTKKISLDANYNISNNDWIIIVNESSEKPIIAKINNVVHKSIAAYGISGQTTEFTLLNVNQWIDKSFNPIRETVVYCEPEELELAEEPIDTSIGKQEDEKTDDRIELDSFYEGLESGHWVIVSGERKIAGTSGVNFSELAMLSSVEQTTKVGISGDKIHTFIKLAEPLAYSFKRDTVKIYGNVVKATCGETRREVLGSGDGSKTLQTFTLKQKPLTHIAASNPTGTDSTLKVFVNDIRWHEAETLADRESADRNFITTSDDADSTTIIFGNGEKGARLPTGIENIKAEYRSGIGKAGNLKAEQISLLMDRPLGLKEVINPLRASGGADRESRDQARKNAPLAVRALDRLVSVQDYEDFARVYAGIGKAKAAELTDGRQQLVHVTIAGTEDIPIDETSDLFQNLFQALHEFGDPYQPIRLAVRELMLMVVSANVRILSNYQWEPVVTKMRATMLEAFSFERRELGQDVLLSEVFSVMQSVRGVDYVDIDFFGGIPEKKYDDSLKYKVPAQESKRRLLTPQEIGGSVQHIIDKQDNQDIDTPVIQRLEVNLADFESGSIRPAQLAFLTPGVPETLILNQIK